MYCIKYTVLCTRGVTMIKTLFPTSKNFKAEYVRDREKELTTLYHKREWNRLWWLTEQGLNLSSAVLKTPEEIN